MFSFAMIMLAVAFGVCLLAVLVLVWREMRWISRRAVEDTWRCRRGGQRGDPRFP